MTDAIKTELQKGIQDGVFPNAEVLVAKEGAVILTEHAGQFADPQNAFFDLASLTKPLSTAILCMIAFQRGAIHLDDTPRRFFKSTVLGDFTIRELLNHTAGMIDWAPFYAEMIHQKYPDYQANKKKILRMILSNDDMDRLSRDTRYSDVGYILLGAILEKVCGAPLDVLFKTQIADPLNIADQIFFCPLDKKDPHLKKEIFVPSTCCTLRKRVIQAEVMDRNCSVMGGVSGHAGLFSNARTIHVILSELRLASQGKSALINKETFDLFARPAKDREWHKLCYTLGFDTPTQGISQAGNLFSKNTIGHLGYAGTSFWWDLDRDFWMILLTNRCMPDRKNIKVRKFRPALHDFILNHLKLQGGVI
ncbi:MAG: serine hydrolase [Deltaproteobacteria bacterium]|nr:serine hydrolase [Deltaproteobacteria bacterium]